MSALSDGALDRLRSAAAEPDLGGTRYRLVRPLGRGGTSSVHLAHDVELDRPVALKVLELADPSGRRAARMLREARIVAALEHPGIVPIHEVGRLADGRVYCAMKYVEGRTLDALLADTVPLLERVRAFQRVCEAVAFAHSRGAVHRDLKPANVLVGEYGQVVVLDWGVAARRGGQEVAEVGDADAPADPSATADGAVVGTPGYLSPEQERGDVRSHDARTDVWQLGALLSFLLCGQPRLDPVWSASAAGRVSSRAQRRRLEAIVSRAMAAEPADRYPDAGALADDVARWLDRLPVQALAEGRLRRGLGWLDRNRALVAVVGAYLVLRTFIFFFTKR